jgi:predicted homoserine dehydrogenase-like protein
MMVDTELERRQAAGQPVQIGLVGAGRTARMILVHLLAPVPGLRVAAIANRTPQRAVEALEAVGCTDFVLGHGTADVDRHAPTGPVVIVDDPLAMCEARALDVIVDVTGSVEFGAKVALAAFAAKKHLVLVNAELDSTLGPILKVHADRAGVVVTDTDGDEPGVAMTLLRYLRSLGLKPVAAGNLKGLVDHYRTPETQRAFAQKYQQDPHSVTAFADGTKLSMEATVLANATGFGVGIRGMFGPPCKHVNEIAGKLPIDAMLGGGLVDYALGAEPHTGAFVVVHEEHPLKMRHLAYLKMGDGPLYVFYTPYHLPHIQVASTIARAALFRDPTVAPLGAPRCDVITVAKRDLRAGETLDGLGGFCAYGVIENAAIAQREGFLPMGLSDGCLLSRNVAKDEPIVATDVEMPRGRTSDRLRAEQDALFGATWKVGAGR